MLHLEDYIETLYAAGAADEIRVLEGIAARLCLGLRQYGKMDLANDKRCWPREEAEELLDFLVYREIGHLVREMKAPE